jgi:hypothetical protein
VPFQTLIDFLEDFPTVSKEQAIAALEQAKEDVNQRMRRRIAGEGL